MYDAIIVGARCAGSPTAMLLAQKGYKVLLVDKASFPSDTISTHIIWPPGVAHLKSWGLLEKVVATGCPRVNDLTFDVGSFALHGSPTGYEGTTECYAPRRTILDKILVDAARDAGAEVRERCYVEGVVWDGGRVTGIRCRDDDGRTVTEKARVVIGADGRNSAIARHVGAEKYNEKPDLACWYYTYWSGVPVSGVEFYMAPEHAIGYLPTNDGQVCVPVASKRSEFEKIRSDVEGYYWKALEAAPTVAERLRSGRREEKFYGTGDVPNFFRKSHGPGWALVGDAGYHKDPIGAQGISDAFREAELLAAAADDGLSGTRPIDDALAAYAKTRDEEMIAMYEFNSQMAELEPPPAEMQLLMGALRGNRAETDRFFGVIAGTVPVPEFFSPQNTMRIMAA